VALDPAPSRAKLFSTAVGAEAMPDKVCSQNRIDAGLSDTCRKPGPVIHAFSISMFPNMSTSNLVLKKQSNASAARQMTESFSLNEVFNTIGTHAKSSNVSMERWERWQDL
jgi:hypothetical protein